MTEVDKLKARAENPAQDRITLDIDSIVKAMMDTMTKEMGKQANIKTATADADEFRSLFTMIVVNVSAGVIKASYLANVNGNPEQAAGIEAANLATAAMHGCRFALGSVIADINKK